MIKHTQTRLYKGSTKPEERGNCYCTVMACIMDLESPEHAFQVQEHFNEPDWLEQFVQWISSQGWILHGISGHQNDDDYYFVTGTTERDPTGNVLHICIYLNGELYWDPHPDRSGLVKEKSFSKITKKEDYE